MAKYNAAESVLKEAFPEIKVENKTLQGAAFLIGDEKDHVRIYVGVGKEKSDENFEIDRAIITYKIPEETSQIAGIAMMKAIETVSKEKDIGFEKSKFEKNRYTLQKDMTKPSIDEIKKYADSINDMRRNIGHYCEGEILNMADFIR